MTAFDVLVEGRSLPALQAALDLAELGLRVLVVGDTTPDPDGRPADVRGDDVPERDAEGAIAGLLQRVSEPLPGTHSADETPSGELLLRVVHPIAPLLRGRDGGWHAQPEPNVWGIPADPVEPRVTALLGGAGVLRVYWDRIAPLLTVGKTRGLGQLVQRRLGRAALAVLTELLVRDRFGVPAAAVDVALAAPGLNETLTRAGSLSAAAATYVERHRDRDSEILPAAGWEALRTALVERLGLYGAEFSAQPVSVLTELEEGGWEARFEERDSCTARAVVTEGLDKDGDSSHVLTRWRVYADIAIEASQDFGPDDCGLLQAGEWTLRLHGSGLLEARGPRFEAAATSTPPSAETPELLAVLDELLAASGARPTPGASWHAEHRVAPYATVKEREAEAEHRRAASERRSDLLVVGREGHGDDLSAALLAAHEGAVALRRRLLGLSEAD